MDSVKVRHSLYLILATLFWGTTFVAQSIAMDAIGPYTYNACRFFVGAVVLLPLAIITGQRDPLSVNYHKRESREAVASKYERNSETAAVGNRRTRKDGQGISDNRGRKDDQGVLDNRDRKDDQAMSGNRGRKDDQGVSDNRDRKDDQGMADNRGRKDDQGMSDNRDRKDDQAMSDDYSQEISSKEKEFSGSIRSAAWLTLLAGGFLTGLFLCLASSFQQVSLVYTTAGKCGFVTALYIIFVPAFGYLFFRRKCSPLVIAAIAVAVAGFYFLCITEQFTINRGDLIALGGSVMFAFQILAVDRFAPRTSPVQLSCLQFVVAGFLSLIPTFLLETPSWTQIRNCIGPILYAGVLSCGGGYTLQTIGQRGLNPTIASLFMSLESVISVLAGWLVLGDALSPREILGCALVFSGVILAQIPLPGRKNQ